MSQTLELKKVLLPGVCAALLLSACGGSSSSSTTVKGETPPPEDTSSGRDDFSGQGVNPDFAGENATLKAGVFLTKVTYSESSNIEPKNANGRGILSPTGNFTFVTFNDVNSITSGTISLGGTNSDEEPVINGSVVEYELFETWDREEGSIVGVVPVGSNEKAFLDTGNSVDVIEIDRVNESSDLSIDLDTISGIYETVAGSDPQITIDMGGGLSGVDSGCILENGKITIPVSEINVFELSYEASGCNAQGEVTAAERNGEYLGIGTFLEAGADPSSIEFFASNGKVSFSFDGMKQN